MKNTNHQEVLMCPPTYYAIEYQINPWMSEQVDLEKAGKQWQILKETFEKLGIKVSEIEPVKHLPDMVFTADQGMVFDGVFIKSNFRHRERQRESIHTLYWFQKREFTIVELPKSAYFEGQGDLLFFNHDTIIIGIGQRTNRKAAQIIGQLLGKKIITFNLIDPYFFHLDTALCRLNENTLMAYAKAFDNGSIEKIKKLGAKTIWLEKSDAFKLACNSFVYQNYIFINKGCSKELLATLHRQGLTPVELDLSEFIKGGGGPHCLIWYTNPI